MNDTIMLKRSTPLLTVLLCMVGHPNFLRAQVADSIPVVQKIGILLPLHLDSLFKGNSYRYGNSIPKFAMSTLEFYNGVALAADSLRQEGINARLEVVDSRNSAAVRNVFLPQNSPQLIIGVVQSAAELKILNDLAASRQIPFVSASYPNDGGLTEKPNLIVVNSTLRTHCQSLYKYLQRHHSTDNLLLVTRQNGADARLRGYLAEAAQSTAALKLDWKALALPDTFTPKDLTPYLDSTTNNTIVVASLDDDFGKNVIRGLSQHKAKYTCAAFGMPTWDELPLSRPEYKGVDVYFSTSFLSASGNLGVFRSINQKFKATTNSRPSDMVFKGFELTYRMAKTLVSHPGAFIDHMNDADAKLFTAFKFEPVHLKPNSAVKADYYENKKVYFIKKTDGVLKGVF
jgi:hypothetical protein